MISLSKAPHWRTRSKDSKQIKYISFYKINYFPFYISTDDIKEHFLFMEHLIERADKYTFVCIQENPLKSIYYDLNADNNEIIEAIKQTRFAYKNYIENTKTINSLSQINLLEIENYGIF